MAMIMRLMVRMRVRMIMRMMVFVVMRMIMRIMVMAAVVAPCTGGPLGRLPRELPPPVISNVKCGQRGCNAIMQLHIDIIVDTRLSLLIYESRGLGI